MAARDAGRSVVECKALDWSEALDVLGEVVFIIDREQSIWRANRAFSEMVGLSTEDVVGRKCYEVVHGRTSPPAWCPHIKTLRTGRPASALAKEPRLGRGTFLLTTLPLLDKDGEVMWVVHTVEDVTELKKTEDDLKSARDHLSTLITSMGDGVTTISKDFIISEANPAALKMCGYTADEMIGKHCYEINHSFKSPCKPPVVCTLKRVLEKKKAVTVEHIHYKKDGAEYPVEIVSTPIFDDKGNVSHVLEITRDITERKRVEEALKKYSEDLEQSNKLKDLFIDIMRHDLLNPASLAKGIAEMVLEDEEDPDKKKELQIILKSSERIIDMIENASILARLESGKKLKFNSGDLGNALRSATKEMSPLADKKKVNIKIKAKGEFPARFNPLINDVFSNIISNAIKYGPENSDVIVKIEDRDSHWRISVADKGDGVPDKDKKAIFERFKRIEKGGVKGTGLGLAIVKRVVRAHNGRVWVEDNPGGGSIFYVEIPKG